MKSAYIKILTACIFTLVVFAYPQRKDSRNCDSLKTEYKNKITEWKTIYKEITSESLSVNKYDSLLTIYKEKWNKAHESQIFFINCKHPLVKITVENFENPPSIPSYKNKEKLSETSALNQLCRSLKSTNNSYMFSYSECERRLKNFDYFTINEYDSIKSYAAYFIGEAFKFSKYYTECSADSLFDANFQANIKTLPNPPFEVDENYYQNIPEYFQSVAISEESIEEMRNYLLQNFPQEAISQGISGKVRFCFRLASNGEPIDIKILSEKPPFFGFSEITEQAVLLLKQKLDKKDIFLVHTEMMGSVNYKSLDDRKIDKRIEIQIRPFYSGKIFFR